MTEADKLFEELGYRKEEDYCSIAYESNKDHNVNIVFIIKDKTVEKYECIELESIEITMQELKAINIKCKELGWLDE